jgi:sulfur-oxidizing protein SoxY
MSKKQQASNLTRRELLVAAGAGAFAVAKAGPVSAKASALTASELEAVQRLLGGRMPQRSSRIRLDMPRSFVNGNTVPLAFEVECPMTAADHVKHVHILAPGNPFPEVASFHFTERSGLGKVSTRIRLEAGDQPVLAVAEMSDGSVVMARTMVEVTIGGCGS